MWGRVLWGFPGKESACQCRSCRSHGFSLCIGKIPWRRTWHHTPVFLPAESPGQRSLAGCSPRGHKGSDVTEHVCTESFTDSPSWVATGLFSFILIVAIRPRPRKLYYNFACKCFPSPNTLLMFHSHLIFGLWEVLTQLINIFTNWVFKIFYLTFCFYMRGSNFHTTRMRNSPLPVPNYGDSADRALSCFIWELHGFESQFPVWRNIWILEIPSAILKLEHFKHFEFIYVWEEPWWRVYMALCGNGDSFF